MIPAKDIDRVLREFGICDDERKREYEAKYIQPFDEAWGELHSSMQFPLIDHACRFGVPSARKWLESLR